MTQILVTKPNALKQRDKAALRRSGVVVVETDDPANVKLLDAEGSALSGDEITLAVLKALSGQDPMAINLKAALPKIMADMLASKLTASPEEGR
jgi:hypothetical protein